MCSSDLGAYQVSAYFLAKSTVDIFAQAWPSMLFTCIAYFLIGYQAKPAKFFTFMFALVLDSMAATSLATAGKLEFSLSLSVDLVMAFYVLYCSDMCLCLCGNVYGGSLLHV